MISYVIFFFFSFSHQIELPQKTDKSILNARNFFEAFSFLLTLYILFASEFESSQPVIIFIVSGHSKKI